MSTHKQQLWFNTLKQGLTYANKGSVFWTQSDAMSSMNQFRNITRTTLTGAK